MATELWDILDFLEQIPVFMRLDEGTRTHVPHQMKVIYLRRETALEEDARDGLWLLRVGASEIRAADGQLLDRIGEGGILLPQRLRQRQQSALLLEDSLLYHLPTAALQQLQQRHPGWPDTDGMAQEAACHHPEPTLQEPSAPLQAALHSLDLPEALRCPADTEIAAVAGLMTRHERGSILLEARDGTASGILTDRDLRQRILAAGLHPSTTAEQVMSRPVTTLARDASVITALNVMGQAGIHHLPICDDSGRARWLFSDDLLADLLGDAGINAAKRLQRAPSLSALAAAWEQAPHPLDQPETIPVHVRLAQYNQRLGLLLQRAQALAAPEATQSRPPCPDPALQRNERLPGQSLLCPALTPPLRDWLNALNIPIRDGNEAPFEPSSALVGFFRDRAVDRDGREWPTIDLAAQLVTPIRAAALARSGDGPTTGNACDTISRLERLTKHMDPTGGARALIQALDRAWMLIMRETRHHWHPPRVAVAELTPRDRHLLRRGLQTLQYWQDGHD